MAKVPVAGRSYIEVDDADGVARNLSAFVEEVGPWDIWCRRWTSPA